MLIILGNLEDCKGVVQFFRAGAGRGWRGGRGIWRAGRGGRFGTLHLYERARNRPRLRLAAWYIPATGAIAFIPYLSVILSDGGVPDAVVPVLIGMIPLGTFLGGPLWTWVADRSGTWPPR